MSTSQVRAIANGEARREHTILDLLEHPKVSKGIQAVAGTYMTADRFLRLAVNAISKTPLLMQCEPKSVLGAFMTSAALALEPNTPQQQAFLIPYKKKIKRGNDWLEIYECQFQVGYRGFVTLAHRSPYISSLQAETIHENDVFNHMMGTESFLKFQKTLKDRGAPIGAFSYVKLESGIEMACVLPLEEILKIRGKSETFNALTRNIEYAKNDAERDRAEKKLADTPWEMWFDDMAAKSAIKKHAKQLPLMPGDAISAAATIDNQTDANTIDMSAMADPDLARSVVQEGMPPPAALSNEPSEEARFDFPAEDRRAEREPIRQAAENSTPRAAKAQAGGIPAQGAASAAPASTSDAHPTYADVAKSLREAKTLDGLDLAADLIRDVEDDDERGDLEHIYGQRRGEIESAPTKSTRRTSNVSME